MVYSASKINSNSRRESSVMGSVGSSITSDLSFALVDRHHQHEANRQIREPEIGNHNQLECFPSIEHTGPYTL